MKMKEKAETFVLEYLKRNTSGVDVMNSDFIDSFAEATGAKASLMTWGPNICKYANKTLSRMYKLGILSRSTLGLPSGNWQPGLPKWVYVYYL